MNFYKIQSIKNSVAEYKAYEFFRKFTCFICELGELTDTQRNEFVSEVEEVAEDASGNVIMGLVDRLDNINKEKILANLVVAKGFNKPAICVDVHVHRICNRWGYVKTKEPDETEMVLRNKLPEKYWMDFNTLLVTHGQNICKPQKPICENCSINQYCKKLIK